MLAAFDDPQAFAHMAAQIAGDPVLRKTVRQGARITAGQVDWDQVVDDLASALSGLAQRAELVHA
jgi:hypothetical protein